MSPGKPRSDRRCGKGNTKTPRSVDHILQLPLWSLLFLHNNQRTHARTHASKIPHRNRHISHVAEEQQRTGSQLFVCWLSLGLFNCPKLVFCDHTVPSRLLRDIAAFFRRSSVRPSVLSGEAIIGIGKARTMAPKDVDTASFVFCSHWYVPPDVHHIQNLGTAGLSFSYIRLSFCVFLDFWGLCRFPQKPNFASGCVFLVFSLCFFFLV